MRNAGRKYKIRKTRDFIKIKLILRREKSYKHKVTPNETKNKNKNFILEKAFIRASEFFLNTSLNTRKAFRKYLKRKNKYKNSIINAR